MTLTLEQLDEIARLAKLATPGPYYTCGLPWFNVGSGVMAGSPDPHVGYVIADTEQWDGERAEYLDNDGPVKDLSSPDDDANYFAELDPATVLELVRLARLGMDATVQKSPARGTGIEKESGNG